MRCSRGPVPAFILEKGLIADRKVADDIVET